MKFEGGTLEYTGVGDATDRQFTVSPGGATILNNGSDDLYFNSTAALAYSGSGPRTLTLGGSASVFGTRNTSKLAASIADGPGGATSIVKTGSDIWLLTGAATYTGGTTVLSGVLGISGDHSAATGAIVLAGGRIEVADQSIIGGDVVIRRQTTFQGSYSGTAGAQTNSPNFFGDSPEEFEIEGDLTFEEESELDMGINGSQPETGYDRMDIDGNVSVGGATLKLFAGDFTPILGDIYYIINNKGANAINGQFANAAEGSILESNGLWFQITYFADVDGNSFIGGNDLALMAVPEPASICLALSAAALLAARFARRRTAG